MVTLTSSGKMMLTGTDSRTLSSIFFDLECETVVP